MGDHRVCDQVTTDLLIRLSHELAVLLELYHTPDEIASGTWTDAIDALGEVRQILEQRHVPAPSVVENVLKTASVSRD